MAKVSEDDFVSEGLSEEEKTAMNEPEPQHEEETETSETPSGVLDADKQAQAAVEQSKPVTVDLRALQEARAESREVKEKYRLLEERTNTILAMLGPKQEEKKPVDDDPEPDRNTDIFAHNAWLTRQLEGVKNTVAAEANERAKANEAAQYDAQIWGRWESDGRTYAQENPDFGNAAKWLSDYRDKQLQAISVVDPRYADPRMRNWQIEEELKQIVVGAAQAGKSSAALIYDLAKGYGYQMAAVQQQQPDNPEAIRRMAEQQERHRSLSEANGGEPPKALDAKALANMSDAAFKKLMADPTRAKEIDELMGIE